jgi:hypothetical protein
MVTQMLLCGDRAATPGRVLPAKNTKIKFSFFYISLLLVLWFFLLFDLAAIFKECFHGKTRDTVQRFSHSTLRCETRRDNSSLPSRSSRLAPPPVLTWLTLSSVPHLAQHVAVSPPPVEQKMT